MRTPFLALLTACSFTPGTFTAGSGDSDGGDGAGSDLDGSVDVTDTIAADAATRLVRLIDLDDTKIIGGPHVDFPVFVAFVQPWLESVANGGDVARDDGFDIYFSSDQAGVTRLAHEIEVYSPTTGTLAAWVKVPSLVTTTVLYLHYGDMSITTPQANPTAVWTGGYELVLHLGGTSDATAKSSALASSNLGAAVAPKLGDARSFDGASSSLDMGSGTAIDNIFSGGGTAEGWFNPTSYGEGGFGRIYEKGNTNGWALHLDDTNVTNTVAFLHGDSQQYGMWGAPSNSVVLNTWQHIAVVYDKGATPTMYFNGSSVAVTVISTLSGTASDDATYDLYVGNRSNNDRTFAGMLDELRLSSVSRSSGWIETQYRNQADPAGVYSISAPL